MRKYCCGFSLMESLITLLVLSIGMLGLGQLQARLWVSSGDLHSLETAYLTAANVIEISEINRLFTLQAETGAILPSADLASDISYKQSSASTGSTLITQVQMYWERPSGADKFTLEYAVYTAFDTADTRWLMPTGEKQPPIGSEIPLIP